MHYDVQARLKPGSAADLLRKLTDGTVARQKPDGAEIVASMERARVGKDGVVRWSEQCFCSPPLKHERETVYDGHFADLTAEATEGYREFEGEPFMEFLARTAKAD